jgi:FkbM family methyltransferase
MLKGASLPPLARPAARWLFRAWARLGKAPGYYYRTVEEFGATLAATAPLPTRLPNGCRVRCDLTDHVQRHMWFLGAYEPVESFLFSRLLRPGMTVIDAGANVGQYTLLASTAIGREGAVHGFEPAPENFARLRQHVQENSLDNVRLVQAALWDRETTVTVALPDDAEAGNCGSFHVSATHGDDGSPRVPALRLDDYAGRHGLSQIHVIKMDIEGAEPAALRGALGVLGRDRPTLMLEINRQALAEMGGSPEELWDLLSGFRYRAWQIGYSSASSGSLAGLSGVDRVNAIFYAGELPRALRGRWTLRQVLRWARRKW